MGAVKDEMKPTTEKGSKLFGIIKSKKKAKDAPETAKTFCDKLAEIDMDLERLITIKEADLKNEKGQEDKNSVSLSRLKAMKFHLDEVINHAAEYSQN